LSPEVGEQKRTNIAAKMGKRRKMAVFAFALFGGYSDRYPCARQRIA
jgi:hypothetical protein